MEDQGLFLHWKDLALNAVWTRVSGTSALPEVGVGGTGYVKRGHSPAGLGRTRRGSALGIVLEQPSEGPTCQPGREVCPAVPIRASPGQLCSGFAGPLLFPRAQACVALCTGIQPYEYTLCSMRPLPHARAAGLHPPTTRPDAFPAPPPSPAFILETAAASRTGGIGDAEAPLVPFGSSTMGLLPAPRPLSSPSPSCPPPLGFYSCF